MRSLPTPIPSLIYRAWKKFKKTVSQNAIRTNLVVARSKWLLSLLLIRWFLSTLNVSSIKLFFQNNKCLKTFRLTSNQSWWHQLQFAAHKSWRTGNNFQIENKPSIKRNKKPLGSHRPKRFSNFLVVLWFRLFLRTYGYCVYHWQTVLKLKEPIRIFSEILKLFLKWKGASNLHIVCHLKFHYKNFSSWLQTPNFRKNP